MKHGGNTRTEEKAKNFCRTIDSKRSKMYFSKIGRNYHENGQDHQNELNENPRKLCF